MESFKELFPFTERDKLKHKRLYEVENTSTETSKIIKMVHVCRWHEEILARRSSQESLNFTDIRFHTLIINHTYIINFLTHSSPEFQGG